MDEQKCKAIVQYMDVLTKRFWVILTRYESKDFAAFKTSILAKYPHADQGTHYTIHDLEHIVLNTADSDISMEMELLQYYQQFCPIALWLEANSKISVYDHDQYFWQGLLHSAQRAIDQCLEVKEINYM
ncbi:hypothetical protein BDR05DRAFT_948575 [Suillus weaverae]|nr:hypothetical protein BDR05DRAFT_948575 [Suillus weaverae]